MKRWIVCSGYKQRTESWDAIWSFYELYNGRKLHFMMKACHFAQMVVTLLEVIWVAAPLLSALKIQDGGQFVKEDFAKCQNKGRIKYHFIYLIKE